MTAPERPKARRGPFTAQPVEAYYIVQQADAYMDALEAKIAALEGENARLKDALPKRGMYPRLVQDMGAELTRLTAELKAAREQIVEERKRHLGRLHDLAERSKPGPVSFVHPREEKEEGAR